MAPSGHAGKSPGHGKSPASAKSNQAASPSPRVSTPLFALLLNGETKDEGEELLDYSFPPDNRELQRVALMKGVLIASCGVMRAAVGEDPTIFVFWAEDGSRQYKASLCRIEGWIACIVLPGSVPDRTAQFLVEEAVGLVALRHGKLSSLRGHFRQLDRIFRALEVLWSESLRGGGEAGGSSLLYASLGAVPWSPLADTWRAEVRERVAEWEERWQATAGDGSLALPEGFALFLGQTLMGTSLADRAFEVCLRLCVLEGVLGVDDASGHAADQEEDASDVRCHSLFLQRDETGASVLPSHQYSVLRRGPWLLFMLWRMASVNMPPSGSTPSVGVTSPKTPARAVVLEGASPKTPAKALLRGSDPFGVDLCLELLGSLSLPEAYAKKPPPAKPRHSTPRSGSGSRETWRSFALPCPSVFKPGSRRGRSSRHHDEADALPPRPEEPPRPASSSLCALELGETGAPSAPSANPSFGALRRPQRSAEGRLSEPAGVLCPEMWPRAASHKCCEWAPWIPRELASEWSELEWLAQTHGQRRAAWREAPSTALTRHPLLTAWRNPGDIDRMWDECLEESSLEGAGGARRPEATRLGDGQPWRFQVGAPFELSDVPPLISAGALAGGGHCRAWTAISAMYTGDKTKDTTAQRVLLHVDTADGPS